MLFTLTYTFLSRPSDFDIASSLQVICVSVELKTEHTVESSRVTVKKLESIGKPDPVMVKMSPPRAFAIDGLTDETTNGIVMSATPDANGRRPFESLISAFCAPALGALVKVH